MPFFVQKKASGRRRPVVVGRLFQVVSRWTWSRPSRRWSRRLRSSPRNRPNPCGTSQCLGWCHETWAMDIYIYNINLYIYMVWWIIMVYIYIYIIYIYISVCVPMCNQQKVCGCYRDIIWYNQPYGLDLLVIEQWLLKVLLTIHELGILFKRCPEVCMGHV